MNPLVPSAAAKLTAAIPWEPRTPGETTPIWRCRSNPLTGYRPAPGVHTIFNSAVVPYGDMFVGVFRAEDQNGMSALRLGHSLDGVTWNFETKALDLLCGSSECRSEYAYDPRVCRIDDAYYVTWCNGNHGPTIGVMETRDFVTFKRHEDAFLPFNRNGVLFPRRINGRFAMLSRPSDDGHTPFGEIFYSESPDLTFWGRHRHVMRGNGGWWEDLKIGPGPTPIETPEGWLLIYHGVCHTCNGYVYRMGVALLDLDRPWQVLSRSRGHVFGPEASYETAGAVPNVVFPCSVLRCPDSQRLAIYYGAADTHIALAFAYLDELVEIAKGVAWS
ncbi:MAG: glycoside hydrolase family 130 protein [Planctomycetales bacterium]|nr:glycoside hydrolase family 130 protein [Planctomycetales bacterium]